MSRTRKHLSSWSILRAYNLVRLEMERVAHLRNLRSKPARLVLSPRRARTYPRAVKVKTEQLRKRPARRRKLVK